MQFWYKNYIRGALSWNLNSTQGKSETNLQKHGIDFVEAQALWSDPDAVEVVARVNDEPRKILIGTYKDRVWAAVFTVREHRVRIISVRRARESERVIYES